MTTRPHKCSTMHVHKNHTKGPLWNTDGIFFLVSSVFLATFLYDSCEIPESQRGTNPCSRFSTCARLMTYDLWTCTQTKITVLDIYSTKEEQRSVAVSVPKKKKNLVNVNVQLGGCTEKTSGKCKPKGCSIELSTTTIMNLCRLLVPYGNDKIVNILLKSISSSAAKGRSTLLFCILSLEVEGCGEI